MKTFIEYLIKSITTKPESVTVEETQDAEGFIYQIKVAEEDMGLVIGKEGKTIKSIRNLAKAKAIKEDIRIRIDLVE